MKEWQCQWATMHILKILSIKKLIIDVYRCQSWRSLQYSAMILIVRQYNLQSTRYIFPQLDKTSDFKLDLSVLDDNPPPYSTSPVRNERLLILIPSRSSVAPNKVSSNCLHASPRSRLQVPAGGASQANCWGRCVRVLCPLSSGQISRCHTSVITGDRTHQPRCCSSSITDARAGSYRYQWSNQLQMTPLMNIYQPKILPRANYNHIMHDSAMIPSNRFWCTM